MLWGTWLLVTGLTFSFMAGIFHAYYTVALAPAVAALVGIGAWVLWQHRASYAAVGVLSFTTALTSVLAFFLLDRTTDYLPWLKWLVVVVGIAAALLLAGAGHLPRRLALATAAAALVAGLAGPAAYAVSTASQPHTGSIPSAGPAGQGGPGGMGGMGGGRGRPAGGTPPAIPGNAAGNATGAPTGLPNVGGTGGLLDASTPSAALRTLLRTDADAYTWTAAVVGANNASGYQLASRQPVMAIGGFNGSDPSPTLAQFQQYVADGRIHWFLAGGGAGGGGRGPGGATSSAISTWVEAHFTATTVGGVTVYDLSTGIQ